MSYRFAGIHLALYGDVAMGTCPFRILKGLYPDSHITALIGADYREIAPLFLQHPSVDKVRIMTSPKDAFSPEDEAWLASKHFHHIFDPMADHNHSVPWYKHRVQPLEMAHMHGLPIDGDDGRCEFTKWFKETDGLHDYVALAAFAGMYSPVNDKRLSVERAQEITDIILAKGLKVLQIGGRNEPRLVGAAFMDSDYFGSIRNILGCRLFIHTDTGSGWCISAYGHPQLGLYSHRYHGKEFVHNIQPVTPNGWFLDAPSVNDIPLGAIEAALDQMLSA